MTADRADFGGRLRQAREARGMSLAQIAASTKISTMVLDALERNDVSRLPGGLFSRAFVRAYAREVGLDPERTVDEFVARFADQLDGSEPPRRGAVFDGAHRSGSSGLRWFGLVLTVALIGLFFGIERYLARQENKPNQPASSTNAANHAKAASPPPAPTPTVPAPIASPLTVPAGQAAASTSPASPAPAASLPLRLVLTTTAPCWVSARVDGTRTTGRTVPVGEHVDLAASDNIVLTVGNAGALTYTINGTPGRALGQSGQVVTVVISAANYQSYLQQ